MDSNKRAKILDKELKAQEKFNKKYYKEADAPKEKKKRAFFVFWSVIFENLGKFFMLNLFYGIIFSLIALAGLMINLILTENEYAQFISNIPLLVFGVLLLGGLLLGPITAACTYIYRNLKSGKHITFFSDFFAQYKSNYKQSILFGIFDAIIITSVLALLTFFRGILAIGANIQTTLILCLIALFLFVYYSMRPYIYLQIVSINLKLPQIVRNALFFTFRGVKQNILSFILFAVMVGLGALITVTPWLALLWLIGGFSLTGFLQIFCVYNVFHHHLIAPEEARAEKDVELDSISYDETDDKSGDGSDADIDK